MRDVANLVAGSLEVVVGLVGEDEESLLLVETEVVQLSLQMLGLESLLRLSVDHNHVAFRQFG